MCIVEIYAAVSYADERGDEMVKNKRQKKRADSFRIEAVHFSYDIKTSLFIVPFLIANTEIPTSAATSKDSCDNLKDRKNDMNINL